MWSSRDNGPGLTPEQRYNLFELSARRKGPAWEWPSQSGSLKHGGGMDERALYTHLPVTLPWG